MQYNLARRDARLSAALLSPVDRLVSGPAWTKVFAVFGSLLEFAYHDAFIGALAFAIVAAAFDNRMGIKVAQLIGKVDANAVKRDVLEKVSGLCLVLLIRSFEHYLFLQGVAPNTRGIAGTIAAVGLFAAYLHSILQHREEIGARPVPVLGAIVDWISQIFAAKLPAAGSGK